MPWPPDGACRDGEQTLRRVDVLHGIQSVHAQIENHLLKLNCITDNHRATWVEIRLDAYTASPGFRGQQCQGLFHRGIEVEWHELDRLLLQQRTQALYHLTRPHRVATDIGEDLLQLANFGFGVLKDQASRIGLTENGTYRLTHFMCDRCAQLPGGRYACSACQFVRA